MFNFKTWLYLDLFTGEFVLQDNNFVNGLWFRECKYRYFFVGHYSDEEEAMNKNGKEKRIRTIWTDSIRRNNTVKGIK